MVNFLLDFVPCSKVFSKEGLLWAVKFVEAMKPLMRAPICALCN